MVVLLLLTRNLSKTDVGLFRQSFALFSLLQIVALLGLGQALTRYVAVFRADKDRAAVLGTVRWGMAVASGAAIAVGVVLYALSGWIANTIYDNPEPPDPAAVRRICHPARGDHHGGARRLLGLPHHAAQRAHRADAGSGCCGSC